MLRYTLILCVSLFVGMLIYGDPSRLAPAPTSVEVTQSDDAVMPALITALGDRRLTLADGRVLEITAVIDPSDDRAPDTLVASGTAPNGSGDASLSASAPSVEETATARVAVTGTSVNLREGPSTDTRVLDALARGTEADLIAALDNGWVQIRVASTGTMGYMAERFVTRVN
ncbi:MAG: SH3 domain-containing protein [Pseudomonadota bacterium]